MYSDESGHSESEFLLSVGRNFEPNDAYKSVSQLKEEEIQKKINMLFTELGGSVWEKTVPLVFSTALSLRPRTVLKPSGTVFFPYGPPAR